MKNTIHIFLFFVLILVLLFSCNINKESSNLVNNDGLASKLKGFEQYSCNNYDFPICVKCDYNGMNNNGISLNLDFYYNTSENYENEVELVINISINGSSYKRIYRMNKYEVYKYNTNNLHNQIKLPIGFTEKEIIDCYKESFETLDDVTFMITDRLNNSGSIILEVEIVNADLKNGKLIDYKNYVKLYYSVNKKTNIVYFSTISEDDAIEIMNSSK